MGPAAGIIMHEANNKILSKAGFLYDLGKGNALVRVQHIGKWKGSAHR